MIVNNKGRSECAWCCKRLKGSAVCLPGLGLTLCPACAVHVGSRLAEEGEDAELLELGSLVAMSPRGGREATQ